VQKEHALEEIECGYEEQVVLAVAGFAEEALQAGR